VGRFCQSRKRSSVLLQSKWDKPPARISYNFERRFPMPKRIRKRFTAQEKVAILRLHLLERTPISDLCDKHGIHPTMFYRWQKEFFENAAAAFEPRSRRAADANERRVALLEQKLQRKHEVLSELMEEHIKLKKELGEL
jgi:transposase